MELLALFESGVHANVSVNVDANVQPTHAISVIGSDGALKLVNASNDFVSGFRLERETGGHRAVEVDAKPSNQDGRIAATARLVSRLVDRLEGGDAKLPTIQSGARVQFLIDAATRSSDLGQWIDTTP